MKKFLLKICLFLLFIIVMDVTFGCLCNFLYNNAKGGETLNQKYILRDNSAKVLIMGSSRSRHHYSPQIIEDSLGLATYNCGLDGNGIIYQYGLLKLILKRSAPRIIVYDITANFDIRENDNKKYLNNLRKHFDEPSIKSMFNDIDNENYLKMYSNLYRFNWTFLTYFRDFVSKNAIINQKGFDPMKSTMDYEPKQEKWDKKVIWDEKKYFYFDRFVKECKKNNIRLIVSFSPFYHGFSREELLPVMEYCSRQNIQLMDYNNLPSIANDRSLFADSYHLNEKGAKKFSAIFAHDLKKIMQ